MDRLDRVLGLLQSRLPGTRLVHKADVAWVRVVGRAIRPVLPEVESQFTTAALGTIWLPAPVASFPRDRLAAIVAHELVHLLDQRRWGPLFYASYGVAMPAGRTMRAYWERRAYVVDLLIARERGGDAAINHLVPWLVERFAGREYAFMWAGRQAALAFLQPAIDGVRRGTYDAEDPYAAILAAWRGGEAG
jgi:hypothetical protein